MTYDEALKFVWENAQGGAAKSSSERFYASVIMSLYDASDYTIGLGKLLGLDADNRDAVQTLICGWRGDDTLHYRIIKLYGEAAWDKFFSENQYQRKKDIDLNKFSELIFELAVRTAETAEDEPVGPTNIYEYLEGTLYGTKTLAWDSVKCGLLDNNTAIQIKDLFYAMKAGRKAKLVTDYKAKTEPIYQKYGITD